MSVTGGQCPHGVWITGLGHNPCAACGYAACEHTWVVNSLWDGGPTEKPAIWQCVRCNAIRLVGRPDAARLAHEFAMKFGLREKLTYEQADALDKALAEFLEGRL